MKKTILVLFIISSFLMHGIGQKAASLSTDISILRNLSEDAGFTAFGQTVRVQVHFTEKESAYASINYYTNGKYKNSFTALPYDPLVNDIKNYTSSSKLGYRHFSVGWQHFFKGGFDPASWSLYSLAGFGVLTGKVENTYNPAIDTAAYYVSQRSIEGSGTFRRLTLDLGAGIETQLGTGIFLYSEVRTWLPLTNFPSPYLFNNNMPRTVILSGGVRILFDY